MRYKYSPLQALATDASHSVKFSDSLSLSSVVVPNLSTYPEALL